MVNLISPEIIMTFSVPILFPGEARPDPGNTQFLDLVVRRVHLRPSEALLTALALNYRSALLFRPRSSRWRGLILPG